MHEIYNDSGSFNLNYQLPQIVYSFLISYFINFIIEYLTLSEETVIAINSKKGNNQKENMAAINRMKLKFHFFFIVTFILLLLFSYYISCFCCIYEKTQIHLFQDSFISFGFSLIYPFFINLIPGIFRIFALKNKKGNKICLYKLSRFIEFIC